MLSTQKIRNAILIGRYVRQGRCVTLGRVFNLQLWPEPHSLQYFNYFSAATGFLLLAAPLLPPFPFFYVKLFTPLKTQLSFAYYANLFCLRTTSGDVSGKGYIENSKTTALELKSSAGAKLMFSCQYIPWGGGPSGASSYRIFFKWHCSIVWTQMDW